MTQHGIRPLLASLGFLVLCMPDAGCQRHPGEPRKVIAASQKQAVATGTQVTLQRRPHRKVGADSDIAMFPGVQAGAGVSATAAAKINASLDRFNAEVLKDARECHQEQMQAHPKQVMDDWERTIEVTMRGPHYLSLVAEDEFDCLAPHPLDDEIALVYDLTTGLPVNWMRLLPKEARGEVIRSPHRLSIGFVHWPAMVRRAAEIEKADPEQEGADCAKAYNDPEISLNVWLDAKEHAVVLSPVLGNHYDTAMCSEQVKIHAEEATRLGFAPEMVAALQAASTP